MVGNRDSDGLGVDASREFVLACKGVLALGLILLVMQFAVAGAGLWLGFNRKVLATLAADVGWGELVLLVLPLVLIPLLLNLLLMVVALIGAQLMIRVWPDRAMLAMRAWLLFLLLWLTVFWENARLFPLSSFRLGINVPEVISGFSLWYAWGAGLLLGSIVAVSRLRRRYGVLLFIGAMIAGVWLRMEGSAEAHAASVTSKPNVFIIGIDSVRPDMVGVLGEAHSLTPHVDRLLANGSVFRSAYTPIARTYPSWLAILSGRYPLHSGARVNLMSPAGVDREGLLPQLLRQQGYRTVHAIDERRFSGIDESYGFDQVVGPPRGIKDFLAYGLRDNPLTNLVVASRFGRYLLPYHHANRALDLTYSPDGFLRLLAGSLKGEEKPLFMAVHFCLPHWPYKWGELSDHNASPLDYYRQALMRADRQVGELMRMLEQRGFLDNAIVVMLSDHGESHGLPQDMPFRLAGRPMGQAWGHGTDVMSLMQSRVLLGLAGYGQQRMHVRSGIHDETVTLLDVSPTLADLLDLQVPWRMDGRSLSGVINGRAELAEAPVFMESEFDLQGVSLANPDIRQLLDRGIGYYHLVDGQVELTNEALASIVRAKQRAVMQGDHMLALYPHYQGGRMILADLRQGEASPMTRQSCAQDDRCSSLFKRLETFYGAEISENPLLRLP